MAAGGQSGEQELRWAAWMRSAQQGDASAYNALLVAITPFVRALVRRYHHRPERCEDAVQEVLLTVHRVRHTWDPDRPLSPWLTAIATRRAIDVLRREARIARREVADELAYETFAAPEANQETGAVRAAQTVEPLLAALSAQQRAAVSAVKLRGLSVAEAAAETGVSVTALKVQIHRAIKRLRQLSGNAG